MPSASQAVGNFSSFLCVSKLGCRPPHHHFISGRGSTEFSGSRGAHGIRGEGYLVDLEEGLEAEEVVLELIKLLTVICKVLRMSS